MIKRTVHPIFCLASISKNCRVFLSFYGHFFCCVFFVLFFFFDILYFTLHITKTMLSSFLLFLRRPTCSSALRRGLRALAEIANCAQKSILRYDRSVFYVAIHLSDVDKILFPSDVWCPGLRTVPSRSSAASLALSAARRSAKCRSRSERARERASDCREKTEGYFFIVVKCVGKKLSQSQIKNWEKLQS